MRKRRTYRMSLVEMRLRFTENLILVKMIECFTNAHEDYGRRVKERLAKAMEINTYKQGRSI